MIIWSLLAFPNRYTSHIIYMIFPYVFPFFIISHSCSLLFSLSLSLLHNTHTHTHIHTYTQLSNTCKGYTMPSNSVMQAQQKMPYQSCSVHHACIVLGSDWSVKKKNKSYKVHYFHTVSRKNTVNLYRAIVSLHYYNAEWGEHMEQMHG